MTYARPRSIPTGKPRGWWGLVNRAFLVTVVFLVTVQSGCSKSQATGPGSSSAKVNPMEMEGWKGFRWGMSVAEVEKVAHDSGFSIVKKDKGMGGEDMLFLSDHRMSVIDVQPVLLLAPTLVRVGLVCPDEKATITVYEMVKKDLTEAFGISPTSKHRTGGPERQGWHSWNDVWSYPRTTVRILFEGEEQKPNNNLLVVSYQDPKSIRVAQ